MPKEIFPQSTPELAAKRKQLAPDVHDAFQSFSERVFAAGALPVKIKQLIAVAAAHITQCPYCIRGHTKAALRSGATAEEIMEAIWVAAEMRAGGAYAHSVLALDTIEQVTSSHGSSQPHERLGVGVTVTLRACEHKASLRRRGVTFR